MSKLDEQVLMKKLGVGVAVAVAGVGLWVVSIECGGKTPLDAPTAKAPTPPSSGATAEAKLRSRRPSAPAPPRAEDRGAHPAPTQHSQETESVGEEGAGAHTLDFGDLPSDLHGSTRTMKIEEPQADPDPVLYSPSAEGINDAVQDAGNDILHCYQSWLGVNGDIEGRVRMEFTLLPGDEGESATTEVGILEDDVGHELFTGCVSNVFAQLNFEAVEGGEPLHVIYPMEFSVGDSDE